MHLFDVGGADLRLGVIGSCITRDVWQICGLALPARFAFVARTSLASMFAPPFPGGMLVNAVGLGDWQVRMLGFELQKTGWNEIAGAALDAIIVDFIDERFDLVELDGGVINLSGEVEKSGILDLPACARARTIPRLSQEARLHWSRGLDRLAQELEKPSWSSTRIVLHSSRWGTQYRDGEGLVHPYPKSIQILSGNRAFIADHNLLLRDYHAAFLAKIPRAEVIEVDRSLLVADKAHPWGLSPFHFIREYYHEFAGQAAAIGLPLTG
jgi:hypothetical protein